MYTFLPKTQAWLRKHATARTIIIVILIALCIVEVRELFNELEGVSPVVRVHYQHGHFVRPVNPPEPTNIEAWMTFGYVNFIFNLPSEYLKNSLMLDNQQYPNVQISKYARAKHLDNQQFLLQVRQAVGQYKR